MIKTVTPDSQPPKRWIALLRGINVGGHNKIPMEELRSLCAGLGWENVATYIQSGNIMFSAPGSTSTLEKRVAEARKMVAGTFEISCDRPAPAR